MRLLVAFFLAIATTVSYGQNANVRNEAALTIAACGKPVRDYTFPKTDSPDRKTRFLSYRKITLWFMDGGSGWSFQGWGKSADDIPVLDRAGVAKLLPCFAKIEVPAAPVTTPIEAAAPPTTNSGGGSSDFSGVLVIVLWIIGAILYFVPWFVASRRRVNAQGGIIALNVLLGWTLLGWVGALIWAISAETEEQAKLREAAFAHMAESNRSQFPPS
jgi:hypothetical protein